MSLDTLRNCPLFAALNAQQLAALATHLRRQRLQPGEVLFRQQDEALDFYVVESGVIKLTRLSPDGEEKVIEMIRSGESFAEAVMFMDTKHYPVSAQAVDKTSVLVLKNRHFLALLGADNTLALRMLGQLSMRLHGLVQEIEKISLHDATHRLVNYLIGESERSHTTRLRLPAPKQVIASRLGIKPETFSRLIQRLRSAGELELNGSELIIRDIESLRRHLRGH